MRSMMSNAQARDLLIEGNNASRDRNIMVAEERWIQSVREACSPACFDPGVIFVGNFRLAKYYAAERKVIQCNVSIQQALSACEKVFPMEDCPPKIHDMVIFLKDLRDKNNRKETPMGGSYKYTRTELMIIRNSTHGLSHIRPNELYGEITSTKSASTGGNSRNRGKKSPSVPVTTSAAAKKTASSRGSTSRNYSDQSDANSHSHRWESLNRSSQPETRDGEVPLEQWGAALENGIAMALGDEHQIVVQENGDDVVNGSDFT